MPSRAKPPPTTDRQGASSDCRARTCAAPGSIGDGGAVPARALPVGAEWKRDALCVIALAVFAVVLLWPATLGGKVMLPADLYLRFQPWRAHASEFPEFHRPSNPMLDPVQQFYPWRVFASRSVREGIIPLWNPYNLCGTPFVANNQSAVFYPETWLFYLMSPERALGWAAALYLFLSAAGMFGFLRTLGLRRAPAMFGAIAFMANGFFVGWMCFPSFRSVGGWLPLMLMAFERSLRAPKPSRAALWSGVTALAVGMQFLAGNLQMSFYVVLCFGAYGLARIAVRRGRIRACDASASPSEVSGPQTPGRAATLARPEESAPPDGLPSAVLPSPGGRGAGGEASDLALAITPTDGNDVAHPPAAVLPLSIPWRGGQGVRSLFLLLLIPLLLGTMLAAGQLLPTVELAWRSSRVGVATFEAIKTYALAPQYLLNALMPDLYGNPMDYNHWGTDFGQQYRAYTETAWYAGAGTLLLAALALILNLRTLRRRQIWFWGGMWLIGVGLAFGTPLDALAYYFVPGFKLLPGIGRAVLLSATAASILAAFGFDAALRAVLPLAPSGSQRRRERGPGGEAPGAAPSAASSPNQAIALLLSLGVIVAGVATWMSTGPIEPVLPGIGSFTLVQAGRCLLFLIATATLVSVLPKRPKLASVLLLIVIAADMYVFVARFTPFVDHKYLEVNLRAVARMKQDPEPTRMLSVGPDALNRMPPNVPMLFGLQDIQCSDSIEIGRSRRLVNALCTDSLGFSQPDVRKPALDLMGVKYLLTSANISAPRWQLLPGYETNLYESSTVLPRVSCPETVVDARSETPEAALKAVVADDFAPARVAYVNGMDGRDAPADLGIAPTQPAPQVHVSRYETNSVEITGDMPGGRMIVLADSMFPGWHAYSGGQEVPIWTVDYAFRGVVPGKTDRVQFVYQPASFQIGAFLACLALAGIAALVTVGWRR